LRLQDNVAQDQNLLWLSDFRAVVKYAN